MTCRCRNHTTDRCVFCTPTRVWWNRGEGCYVFRCANPLLLTDPPEWAFGNTRRATAGDAPSGAIIEGADYIAVRSCFCRCDRCKHFTEAEQ